MLSTSGNAHIVVLLQSSLHSLTHKRLAVSVGIHVLDLRCGKNRTASGIDKSLIPQNRVHIRRYRIPEYMRILGTDLGTERYARTDFLAAGACGDKDYTVGRTRSIDCGGSGILKDVHGLYVIRIYIIHP